MYLATLLIVASAPPLPGANLARELLPLLWLADVADAEPWSGAGDGADDPSAAALRTQRDEAFAKADRAVDELVAALATVATAKTRADAKARSAELTRQANGALAELGATLGGALELERQRLAVLSALAEAQGQAGDRDTQPQRQLAPLRRIVDAASSKRCDELAARRAEGYRRLALGVAGLVSQDIDTARRELLAAVAAAPELAIAHVYLGTVGMVQQDTSLARMAWLRALELDPTNKDVRRALDRIERPWLAQ